MVSGPLSARELRMKPGNESSTPVFNRRQFLSLAASGMAFATAGLPPGADARQARGDYYEGMEDSAGWRREAEQRIFGLRQGEFSIEVQDANGQPLPDAEIDLRLVRHHYGFGCSLRLGRAFSDEYPGELRARYRTARVRLSRESP